MLHNVGITKYNSHNLVKNIYDVLLTFVFLQLMSQSICLESLSATIVYGYMPFNFLVSFSFSLSPSLCHHTAATRVLLQ